MGARENILAMMDRLEQEFAPLLAALISADMLALSGAFQQTRLISDHRPESRAELNALLGRVWFSAISSASELFFAEYRDGFPAAAKSSELVSGLVESFVSNLRPNVADQILATTRNQVRDLMTGGLSSGQAADAVYADLLERMPEISRVRGLLISRTEIHSASQFASWQLARRSSIPLVRTWSSVIDMETRDFGEVGRISGFNHRVMDGAQTSVNDTFLVPRIIGGYEALMFPGDPRGSAGNVINCRCIQLFERA